MKIWAISDTHGKHRDLNIPNVDMVIHAGDSTNWYDLHSNLVEFEDFLDWFTKLNIKYKLLIAGNHDTWATKLYNREKLEEFGIIYLEHSSTNIEGIEIFGSPYTPTFGNWNFMKDRSKLDKYWSVIDKCDILVTHGPPMGILDLSRDRFNNLEFCGDKSLLRHVQRLKPKFHVYGHIHDYEDCLNHGMMIRNDTTFMNVSSVEDGKFKDPIKHHGIIFEI